MSREDYVTIAIGTEPERAIYHGNAGGFVWPSRLLRASHEIIDFYQPGPREVSIGNVTGIEVQLINEAESYKVQLPEFVCKGIGHFISTVDMDSDRFNCMSFAWAACGVLEGGPSEGSYTPIDEVEEIDPGDLIAVGTIGTWRGFDWAKLIDIQHWTVYLNDGMTLNVTGKGGILAGTPINNFQALYPGTKTYKVAGYRQGV